MSGLTSTGFQTPSTDELLTDIESAERAAIDPALDVSSDQPLGQLNGIMAQKLSDCWNALGAVYGAVDPNAAEGTQLDNICALTGTTRPGAKSTVVTETLVFNAATTLSAGAKMSVAGHADQVFALQTTVVVASAGSATGTFVALTPGPIDVQPGTLTNIVTPIAGWVSGTNPALGTLGNNAFTDTQLRILRQEEIAAAGSCNADATTGQLLKVAGILSATVYENATDVAQFVTSSGGTALVRVAHSFEAVIWDGPSPAADNGDIAACLWKNKPTGISTDGFTSATTTDAGGTTQTLNFTRATGKRMYVDITITRNPKQTYVGDATVKQTLSDYISSTQQAPGGEVVALALKAQLMLLSGVLDVPTLALDFSPSPSNQANLFLNYDAVPTLAVADMHVSS